MKYTTNYNLKKPDYADPADIVDINANSDIIDAQMAELETNKVDKTAISDSVTSTSSTTVASSKAVKTAYDKGNDAYGKVTSASYIRDKLKTVDGSGSGLDADLIKGRDIFDYKLIDLEDFNTIIIEELSTTQITSPSRDVWYSYPNYTVTKTGLTRKISVNPIFYGWNSSGDQYGSHDIQILRNGVIIFETTFSKVYTASIIDDIASFSEGANITYAFKQKVTSSGVAKIGIRRKLYTNTIYNRRLV